MKTNIFNFSRLGLLFRRYFAERSRTELIYWIIMVIAFMFIRNVLSLMIMLIIIAGVFYAARFFREIHSSSNGVAYFMIPATQLEKLTVGIVMTSFYYFAMMMIAYVIGNSLGYFFNNMLASMNIDTLLGFSPFHHSHLQWKLFDITIEPWMDVSGHKSLLCLHIFEMFLIEQSIYLLGSIYFKRNQFLSTFLATNIIQILLLILFVIELWLVFGTTSINMDGQGFYFYDFGKTLGTILRYVVWALPPFFWVVSYFRLTEKQI
jgi:hypothetical protein